MALNHLELLLGWAAIVLVAALALYAYVGGFISPDSVQPDLLGLAVILVALAIGVTLDSVFDLLPARLLLALATIVFGGVAFISFLWVLELSAYLAGGATALAFIRAYLRRHASPE